MYIEPLVRKNIFSLISMYTKIVFLNFKLFILSIVFSVANLLILLTKFVIGMVDIILSNSCLYRQLSQIDWSNFGFTAFNFVFK